MSDLTMQYSIFNKVSLDALEQTNAHNYEVTVDVHYDNTEFDYVISDPSGYCVYMNCDATDSEKLIDNIKKVIDRQ